MGLIIKGPPITKGRFPTVSPYIELPGPTAECEDEK